MLHKHYFFVLAFLLCSMQSQAQNTEKQIAILDLTERNSESNEARLISSKHLMNVVGIPYIITTDIMEASTYNMIFCTSFLTNGTLNSEEGSQLEEFVFSGGVFVASRIEADELFDLFGIDGYVISKSRYEMIWDTVVHSPARSVVASCDAIASMIVIHIVVGSFRLFVA